MRFVAHALIIATALAATDWLLDGVKVSSIGTLVLAAFVLGVVNAIVRPLLQVLALPITVVTLGLFYFVVNGAAFALAAAVVPGFEVASLGTAIIGAVAVSVISWLIGGLLGRR